MKTAVCFLVLLIFSVAAAKEGGGGRGEAKHALQSLPGACQIVKKHAMLEASTNVHGSVDSIPSKRVVAIGDVHGSLHGLLTDLFAANITESPDTCKWKQQPESGVLFVQVGDIVDRGPQALEAFQCLRFLQETASTVHSRVVRLVGNHEMWWLEGHLHHRNPQHDTPEKIQTLVSQLVEDILDGKVVVSHVENIKDVDVVFVHAGYSTNYLKHVRNVIDAKASMTDIAEFANKKLVQILRGCKKNPSQRCTFPDELFEAGPERGGRGVGGPLWTDFSVIESDAVTLAAAATATATGATKDKKHHEPHERPFIQVVGHTMGQRIRAAAGMHAVCVDVGMFAYGGRSFLEISGQDGHFRAYSSPGSADQSFLSSAWNMLDLSSELCNPLQQ